MEGYYTTDEAARVLRIGVEDVDRHVVSGDLHPSQIGSRTWVPLRDVHALYENLYGAPYSPSTVEAVMLARRALNEVEAVKAYLGIHAAKPHRPGVAEKYRKECAQLLSRTHWGEQEMQWAARKAIELDVDEIQGVIDHYGPSAWGPVVDLLLAMKTLSRPTDKSEYTEVTRGALETGLRHIASITYMLHRANHDATIHDVMTSLLAEADLAFPRTLAARWAPKLKQNELERSQKREKTRKRRKRTKKEEEPS